MAGIGRLLVAGGSGFIGSNFIRHMLRNHEDCSIVNLDKLTYAGNPENLHDVERDPRYKFVKGDICDANAVAACLQDADAVVNFAAESHVDRSINDPQAFIRTDIFGAYTLLEEARRQNVGKFLQISTDEVYGSVERGFSKETDELKPRNPYSASKAGADRLAYSYSETYGMHVVIPRSSNNYGPYQYPEKVIPLFITNLIEGMKVPLYGDGLNKRDWLYVIDNCEAIELLLQKGRAGEVYNVGAGNEMANIELTKAILKEMGKGEEMIQHVPDRKGHDRRYALSIAKIRVLGWKPKVDFGKGLHETAQWYKQNAKWWKPLKEAHMRNADAIGRIKGAH